MRVIAYLRVSTEEQAESGHGLAAQREAVLRHAEFHGWDDVMFIEDAASGATSDREGLTYALHLLATGQRDALAVSTLDRLSRSVIDFADTLARARCEGWNLLVLDLNLDLSTPQGEFVAHILAAVAQLERRLISERTRNGLAAARRTGTRLGRKPTPVPTDTLARVTELHDADHNLTSIAHFLTNNDVPLPSGVPGVWNPGQVRRMLTRAREEAAS